VQWSHWRGCLIPGLWAHAAVIGVFVESSPRPPVIDCRSFSGACTSSSRLFARWSDVALLCPRRLVHPAPAQSDHQAWALGIPSSPPISLRSGAASSAPHSSLYCSSHLPALSAAVSACSLLWGLRNRRVCEGRPGRVSDVGRRRRGMRP